MTRRQAYATAQPVCHLSIGQPAKKFENAKKSGARSAFSMAAGREIKPSPNCLRILILSGYRKIRASRMGRAVVFWFDTHRNP
jgi:hypothetical protein